MVVKILGQFDDGVGDSCNQERVLYTGTTRGYLHLSFMQRGDYGPLSADRIYLSHSPVNASGYAVERSRTHNDTPLLLIVDTEKVKYEIERHPQLMARALNIGSFIPYEFRLNEKGVCDENEFSHINGIGNGIIQLSEEEVWGQFSKYFRQNFCI